MKEILIRFLVGGVIVSLFAVLGDVLRPKSFAGLFGAAPSVALATIGLTIQHRGKGYVAVEARSMILGAVAFCCYAVFVSCVLRRYKTGALATAISAMPLWFAVSFGLWLLISRGF